MRSIVEWLMKRTFGYRPSDVEIWRESIHYKHSRIEALEAAVQELIDANDDRLGWGRPRPDIAWCKLRKLMTAPNEPEVKP